MNQDKNSVVCLGRHYGMVDLTPEAKQWRPRLLIVDDEENILKALARLVKPLNCDLCLALSAEQAFANIEKHRPDIIISDIRMPEMGGVKFLSIVAKKHPHIDRILMTGYADMAATIGAINDAGVSCYLEKPWDDKTIKKLLHSILKTATLKKQNRELEQQVLVQSRFLQQQNEIIQRQLVEKQQDLDATHATLSQKAKTLAACVKWLDSENAKN